MTDQTKVREFPDEGILDDDYPIWGDFIYVVDGVPYRSDYHGITVADLRRHLKATEIRRCNIFARQNNLHQRRSAS